MGDAQVGGEDPRAHTLWPWWRGQRCAQSPVVWGRAQRPSTLGTFLAHYSLFHCLLCFPWTPRSQTAVP